MKKTVVKATIERFGMGQVTLNIPPAQVKWLADYKGKDLTVEFKEYKSNRSLNQNALLWKIISEIDITKTADPSEDGRNGYLRKSNQVGEDKHSDLYQRSLKPTRKSSEGSYSDTPKCCQRGIQ